MKTILITRHLTETSCFKQQLEATGFRVYGQSLIEFTPVPFKSPPMTDWLFFYSRNGIKFFGESGGFNTTNAAKIATIGQSTATYLTEKYPLKATFVGTGHPKTTASLFLEVARQQSVLFPRARHSRQSVQQLVSRDVKVYDLVVYNNQKVYLKNLPIADILVFTSPLNVEAYFDTLVRLSHQKIIAIGQTTSRKLETLGIKDFIVAKYPSEKGLVEAVWSIG